MKFKYRKGNRQPPELSPTGKSIPRPVIHIFIKYQEKRLGMLALLDTGSDYCLFAESIGEQLGIPIKEGKEIKFSGATAKGGIAYLHQVTLEIGGWCHNCDVGFSPNLDELKFPYALLGNMGFFDKYVVIFDMQKEIIEIKKRT